MGVQGQTIDGTSAPLVSVSITAYNSEAWLSRALDGVLSQRRNFPIEVIIGDDCSQDETIQIAHAYRERHPELVHVYERVKNVGIQRNYFETLSKCAGKYIAWLDADDYWTDPDKLAIQVGMLEADPTISVCVHPVRWITVDGEVKRIYPAMKAGRYGIDEIVRHDFIPTASAVFRNGFQKDIPCWYFDIAPTTDWPVWVLCALRGDILLLDRVMADYWLTPNSACWSRGTYSGTRWMRSFMSALRVLFRRNGIGSLGLRRAAGMRQWRTLLGSRGTLRLRARQHGRRSDRRS